MKFNLDPLQCNDFFMDVREGELILFSEGVGWLSSARGFFESTLM
ncbi:hypothetical protein [Moritella sp. 28]|nr:hypothetical protein [Moritella sp. 28]